MFRMKIGKNYSRPLRAICDTGAQVNIICESTVREFKMIKSATSSQLRGINRQMIPIHGEVEMEMWHRHSDALISRAKFVVISGLLPDHPNKTLQIENFHNINTDDMADPEYYKQGCVDAILGVGILAKQIRNDIESHPAGYIAQRTTMGYIVFGEASSITLYHEGIFLYTVDVGVKDELNSLIRKLWEVDELEEKQLSPEDKFCEDSFKSTVICHNNRYIVTMPMKPEAKLGDSRAMALNRFYGLSNKFDKDPEFKRKYFDFMKGFEQDGHMRLAKPRDENILTYYIPHHAVAGGRKFRVVFDGSAKTTNGESLNDQQFTGPRLQKDLLDIVMKFRTGRVAITADICKMFRQVEIHPSQWDLQRILWRPDPVGPIKDYWITVVTYGLAASPYLAVKALIQCALDNAKEFPTGAQVVLNDFYMDDLLTAVESEMQASQLKEELRNLLKRGGFELAKWHSNCELINDTENKELKGVELQDKASILGIVWNFKTDDFQFQVQSRMLPSVLTKRIITSEAARIFDPQGYVSPVTIRAKLYIQQLWKSGCKWDDPLDPQIQRDWIQFYEELKLINQLRIPRWLNSAIDRKMQIHLFADASSIAYGVAAYIRVQHGTQWKAQLLCSRSKVAPIKPVTIPRLELCAVELSCRLISKIKGIPMFKNTSLYIWTDSEIVLYWIRKPLAELKTFISNRVNRILKAATIDQIRHVRSEQNPADLISRGIKTDNLLTNKLWWQGPDMLNGDVEDWPIWASKLSKVINEQGMVECKKPIHKMDCVLLSSMISEDQEMDLIESKSSLDMVCHITAYVIRFCKLLLGPIRKKQNRKMVALLENGEMPRQSAVAAGTRSKVKRLSVPMLSVREIDNAMNYWLQMAQKKSFPDEYKLVKQGKGVSKSSRLWALTPWMDRDGLLRITGRLDNTNLPLGRKKPIILDSRSTIARRLGRIAHIGLCHGGVQLCTQYLRNKYWIMPVRVMLRSLIHFCAKCARFREQPQQQIMADLPSYRLETTRAFTNCGVDFAGPVILKQSRNVTTKAWIAVFTCMTYKAVHLEVVGGLDSESFIAALSRFTDIRGTPEVMHSDNGTNFVGAARLLNEAAALWQDQEVMRYLQKKWIQWKFTAPSAPHRGGIWEAAVKTAKYHFKRIIEPHLYTYEQLTTVVYRIAACMNSRPLTPMSCDPTDLQTLSPGHFLIGQMILSPYEPLWAEVPTGKLSAWQRMQKIQQDFWVRWSQEYITEQQRRNKWAKEDRPLLEGDLVFVKNELTPSSQWLMARVLEPIMGKDGKVRTYRIKTAGGELIRANTKLCLLPMEPGETNEKL